LTHKNIKQNYIKGKKGPGYSRTFIYDGVSIQLMQMNKKCRWQSFEKSGEIQSRSARGIDYRKCNHVVAVYSKLSRKNDKVQLHVKWFEKCLNTSK
jgi:hypothetical protein